MQSDLQDASESIMNRKAQMRTHGKSRIKERKRRGREGSGRGGEREGNGGEGR